MASGGRPSSSKAWQHNPQIGHRPSSSNRPSNTTRTISIDGRRVTSSARRVTSQAPPTQSTSTKSDLYSQWAPCGDVIDTPNNDENNNEKTGEKRKRYQSSDDPMGVWLPFMTAFLDAMLENDGLGTHWREPGCALCQKKYQPLGRVRLLRCSDCNNVPVCLECLLSRHRHAPLHIIEEWSNGFWQRTSLRDVGLVYYFDHPTSICPGHDRLRDLTIIDVNGIHRVKIKYCTCRSTDAASNIQQLLRAGWYPATVTDPQTCATFRALDYFRVLNVVGSVSCDAFMKTLEKLTDPCQLNGLPDRSNAFFRMERQYSFMIRVKRSGRPFRSIYPGDVAVMCWACPHDGINLPPKWKEQDASKQFLYMLIVALDANFRLKNRIRKNERSVPSLGSGSAYFFESSAYKEHLRNYVAEEDVSTCIAFAALLEKETKITTGLRTSGVGGVVCARHELVRPLGLGDLQKGERYANMDYILLSSILHTFLKRITVSYDISCQWKRKFPERMKCLPPELHLEDDIDIQFGIPTWHAGVHQLECRSQNALSYQEGIGRTDGEGIERTWSLLNGAAWATKEMGEGARHDHLDDKIDHLNFIKDIGLGETLARRLLIAREQREIQEANYDQISSTLKPEIRAEWQKKIDAWNLDKSKPELNPYTLHGEQKNPTEAQIRAQLKKEEAEEAKAGKTPVHRTTAAAFLAAGLRIETTQRKIICLAKSSSLTLDEQTKIHERRVAILAELKSFRDLQRIYMPGAIRALEQEDEQRSADAAPPDAEHIRLWLPSDIPAVDRPSSIVKGLVSAEIRLRTAQCTDALVAIRRHLHGKQHLVAWRDANAVGQDVATRSRTLIDTEGDKVSSAVAKYRCAREALVSLQGEDKMPSTLRPLNDSDLTGDIVVEDDALAQRRLALATKMKNKRKHPSTGRTTLSWIWTAHLGPEDQVHFLDESIRVNWSKSQLRARHWREEELLLEEEMRRVLRTLTFMKQRWFTYAGQVGTIDTPLQHGRRAYALKQSQIYSSIHDRFFKLWSSPFGRDKLFVVSATDLEE